MGYDSALYKKDNDHLNRYRLAKDIFATIENTQIDYSVRIGIYGEWGTGKTTLSNFIEGIAKENKYPFAKMNPWSCNDKQELWALLLEKIAEALDNEGYKIPKELKTSITQRNIIGIFKFFKKVEPFVNTLKFISDKFTPDSKVIKKITGQLKGKNKRIIIVIDDLDRTDPKLIPQLLLGLNEVLDLPGFSFILPFDKDKVAEALAEYSKTYGTGHEFLEKIIDFPYYLPEPTEAQTAILFKQELEILYNNIDPLVFAEMLEHLPKNPRQVKSLARHFKILEPELERHKDENIDWRSIFYINRIKLESPQFVEMLQQTIISDSAWAYNIWSDNKDNEENLREALKEKLDTIANDLTDIKKEKLDYIKEIATLWLIAHGLYYTENLKYYFQLTSAPHNITWSEFYEIFNKWKENEQISDVKEFITTHAKERQSKNDNMVQDFFISLNDYRSLQLKEASDSLLLSENNEKIKNAEYTISLLKELFTTYDILQNINNFELILDINKKWIHFYKNESDKNIRELEHQLIIFLISDCSFNEDELYNFISNRLNDKRFINTNHEIFTEKYIEYIKLLEENYINRIPSIFEEKGEVRKLYIDGYKKALKSVLIDGNSELYTNVDNVTNLLKIWNDAGTNPIIQGNCREFLRFLKDEYRKAAENTKSKLAAIFSNDKIMQALWSAAIATQLQNRALQELTGDRETLIDYGTNADNLPIPDWLTVNQY